MRITLPFATDSEIHDAARFIASLNRLRVCFRASVENAVMEVVLIEKHPLLARGGRALQVAA